MKAILLTASLFCSFSSGAFAQAMNPDAMGPMEQRTATPKTSPSASMTEGVVTKIDKAAGSITLRHLEVKSIGMPAMTMAYKTKDPAMISRVAVGDQVAFTLQQEKGGYVLTSIEKVERSVK